MLDAASRASLWEVQTGQRGLGPPITYQVDGQQQVSFLAGVNSSGGLPPMVYTFALGGQMPMPAP